MVFLPIKPPGYRSISAYSSRYGFPSAVPLRVGPRFAFGPAVSSLVVVIDSPVPEGVMGVGIAFTVSGTVSQEGATVSVRLGSNSPVSATVVGTDWTATLTALVGDVGPNTVTATASKAGATVSDTVDVNVLNGVAFWIDATQPASYTNTGTALNTLKSLSTGSGALSTKVGTPTISEDPRSQQDGFRFDGASNLSGNDIVAQAVPTGTSKPFTVFIVATPDLPTANGMFLAFSDPPNAGNSWGFLEAGNQLYYEKLGSPAGPTRDYSAALMQAGLHVWCFRSNDGLSVGLSVDGGAESVITLTSVGAQAPTKTCVGAFVRNVTDFVYSGWVSEELMLSSFAPDATKDAVIQGLLNKWRRPPIIYAVGDSITTAELATNGGFLQLLATYCGANGVVVNPTGPVNAGAIYPTRHSAVSGNTCGQMQARVDAASTGVGAGTPYLHADLIPLFAGTNPTGGTAVATAAAYRTLLLDIAAKAYASNSRARIAVTTITAISGSTFPEDYNALLPAIWAEHDATYPANPLIRWDAHAVWGTYANGNALGYYVDTTHPTNSGYVALANDPTNGFIQAVFPFLHSIRIPLS